MLAEIPPRALFLTESAPTVSFVHHVDSLYCLVRPVVAAVEAASWH